MLIGVALRNMLIVSLLVGAAHAMTIARESKAGVAAPEDRRAGCAANRGPAFREPEKHHAEDDGARGAARSMSEREMEERAMLHRYIFSDGGLSVEPERADDVGGYGGAMFFPLNDSGGGSCGVVPFDPWDGLMAI